LFSLTFKTILIVARIDVVPHFVELSEAYEKSKLAFGFSQWNPEATPSAEFAFVRSGKQHLFVDLPELEGKFLMVWWDSGQLNRRINIPDHRKRENEGGRRKVWRMTRSDEIKARLPIEWTSLFNAGVVRSGMFKNSINLNHRLFQGWSQPAPHVGQLCG
jgi:hypothetical protein